MAKPLDQFGGWLKFFYIMQWVAIILQTIFTLLFAFSIFRTENTNKIIELLIAFFGGLVGVILYIGIVNVTREKSTYVPSRIIQLMRWVVIFTVVFAVCEGLLYYLTLGTEGLSNLIETGRGLIRILIWYFIWTNYLKESKRVLAYYGQNAKR